MQSSIKPENSAAQDFAMLGIETIAYVKRVASRGASMYVIYAADGTEIVQVEARAAALELLREHDLEPVNVH
jgi:hypothetical protein